MDWLPTIYNTGYEVLISLLLANIVAQWLKVIVNAMLQRKFDFQLLISTGGMPSSHSSTVTAMSFSVGLINGFDSTIFAVTVCVAVIVMYDAAGVRRAASRQAKALNSLVNELLAPEHHLNKEKLKEFLGHTPIEVFAGAGLGILISNIIHRFLEDL